MEKFYTKPHNIILAALAIAFAGYVGGDKWTVAAVCLASFFIPTVRALRWWLGVRSTAVVSGLMVVAGCLTATFWPGAGFSEGIVAAAVVPSLVAGPVGISRILISNRFLRVGFAAVVFSILTSLILTAVSAASGKMPIGTGLMFYWLLAGAPIFAGAELLLSRESPLLPVPSQLIASTAAVLLFTAALAAFADPVVAGVSLGFLFVVVYLMGRNFYRFDEMIVFAGAHGEPVGTGPKLASHDHDTKLHRAFSVFLFNSAGELLLQQRALSKKTWPGVWSNSCCGHVMLHETTAAAAQRRIRYELGLRWIELTIALPDFRYRAEMNGVVENELCPVLIGFTDQLPLPNRVEVEAVRWIDWGEFVAEVEDPETEISPWAVEEVRLLADSDIFREKYLSVTGRKPADIASTTLALESAA